MPTTGILPCSFQGDNSPSRLPVATRNSPQCWSHDRGCHLPRRKKLLSDTPPQWEFWGLQEEHHRLLSNETQRAVAWTPGAQSGHCSCLQSVSATKYLLSGQAPNPGTDGRFKVPFVYPVPKTKITPNLRRHFSPLMQAFNKYHRC